MNNKLFIVCPFSDMENFIRRKYGSDVFFVSAMGTIFDSHESSIHETIKQLLTHQKVTALYLVSDTSCRFLNNALNSICRYSSYPDSTIQKLLINNHAKWTQNKTKDNQQTLLAELILKHQAAGLQQHNLLSEGLEDKISVTGLITSKKNDNIIELQMPAILP